MSKEEFISSGLSSLNKEKEEITLWDKSLKEKEKIILKKEEDVISFFKSLNAKQLGIVVYPDDPGWTVQQMLAHLITIEGPMQWLFEDLLAGGPGSPEDFDRDLFNRTQPRKLEGLSRDELCDKFRSVRRETI